MNEQQEQAKQGKSAEEILNANGLYETRYLINVNETNTPPNNQSHLKALMNYR